MSIEPPNPPSDNINAMDEAAKREYGRQLAMHYLMEDALQPQKQSKGAAEELIVIDDTLVNISSAKKSKSFYRLAAVAAAVCLIGVPTTLIILKQKNDSQNMSQNKVIALHGHWDISSVSSLDFSSGAHYEILSPRHIRLLRGEIQLTSNSSSPKSITVETAEATAEITSKNFLIGSHTKQPILTTGKEKDMKPNNITRLLLLTGVATLMNEHGTISAAENEAVVVKQGEAPEKIVVQANTSFAIDLYHQLAKEKPNENLFVSPYSISSALAMAAEGARGKTAREMGEVLGFPRSLQRISNDKQSIPWEMSQIHTGFSVLNNSFNKPRKDSKTIELKVANAFWGEKTTPINADYINTISSKYGTGVIKQADFKNQPNQERLKLNQWVEKQTGSHIKDLLPPNSIEKLTRLVLVNAIYFKGDWLTSFNEKDTSKRDFTLVDGNKIKTPIMLGTDIKGAKYAAFNDDGSLFNTPSRESLIVDKKIVYYPNKEGFSMVELPYQGKETSMIIASPNSHDGLGKLEGKMTSESLSGWISKMRQFPVEVHLPKFKSKESYRMKESLSKMGMLEAFFGVANFSGISKEPLLIDNVYHKAFIEVDEKGTKAAAATAVKAAESSLAMSRVFMPIFKADRPFIYFIRDNKTGTILFMGKMTNPTK